MSESLSRRVIEAETAVASSLGCVMRPGFLCHASLSRELQTFRARDQAFIRRPRSEWEEASSTPCMRPLQEMLTCMTAPRSVMPTTGVKRSTATIRTPHDERTAKGNCLLGNIARYLHNPINTHPVFLSVGYELSTTATQSVTNRLSDDWGVSTKHQTGVTAHAAAGDLYEIALQREFHEASP